MEKLVAVLFAVTLLGACGGGIDGRKLAQEVCDCSKAANAMDSADPKRSEAQNTCAKKNSEAYSKVKDDLNQSGEFNKLISACASEQIKKSFGK
jgi:hypothetical protein